MVIDIKLLGVPEIRLDEEIVRISLKKAEAMLYYLLVCKKSSKDEMANLLWGDKNDASAKRNMRVNIHNLKKNFGGLDIIKSDGDMLFLNTDIEISIDADRMEFAASRDYEALRGEFLEGFHLRGAYEFEEWLYRERLNYKETYIRKLYEAIESCSDDECNRHIEDMCREIISNDPFDEKAYRILMQHYFDKGHFNKSVDLYNCLVEALDKELYISPSKATRDLYNEIMVSNRYKSNNLSKKGKRLFYGRKKELLYLENQLDLHMEQKTTSPVMINGESGIGKSYLIEEFIRGLEDRPVFVLQANCYLEEVDLFLKPWHEIALRILDMSEKGYFKISAYSKGMISQIFPEFGDYGTSATTGDEKEEIFYDNALREFTNLLSRLISQRRIILVFEDIQWMDRESYRILIDLLKKASNILFICSCRNTRHKSVSDFTASAGRFMDFHYMKLSRFTKEEIRDIIELRVEKSRIDMVDFDDVFRESEGNPFFLNHMLTNINSHRSETIDLNMIRNTMQFRLLGLSDEARKLLYIISIFYSEVDLQILTRLVNKDDLEMFDLIDELEYKDFITETTILGKIYLKVTHNKLREFLYKEQPEWKRLVLHNKVAEYIEGGIDKTQYNYNQYSKLIYHYKNSRNTKKELRYTILYLESIIYLKHEINFGGIYLSDSSTHVFKDEINTLSKRIKNLLKSIKESDYSEDIIKSEMIYFYILGRYYVIDGDYDKFRRYIDVMLENAGKLSDFEYLIKGYKVLIFYGIEIYDPDLIKKYVDQGLDILEEHSFPREEYLFTRYVGVYQLMKGRYVEAHNNLHKSSRMIESMAHRQPIDHIELARNHYYLGELNRRTCKFNKAIEYFDKATALCIENKLGKGLAQFKAKAGQAAFDKGDMDQARDYFQASIHIYNNYGMSWNRSIAEGYMALIHVYDRKYTKAIRSMKRADRFFRIYENLYEKGILYRIKAEIRLLMDKDRKLNDIFSAYMDRDFMDYYNTGMELFKRVGKCHEMDALKNLKKNSND